MPGRWVIVSTRRHADTLVAPAQGVEDAAWHKDKYPRMGKGRVTRGLWGGGTCLIRSMFIAYGPWYEMCPFGEHGAWFKGDCRNGGAQW